MDDPDDLRDIAAIERLKYRYFRTLDLKQWDDFAGCFTDDATGDYAGLVFDTPTALVDFMRQNLGPGLISMHTAHHPEIDVDGDTATGTWYLEDLVLAPELSFALQGAAFYSDDYRRVDGAWRIARTSYQRTFEMSWSTADVPSLKITQGRAYDASARPTGPAATA